MKLLIASDIHGSILYAERLFERAEAEKPDKILLLGDLLYHGPRNDLPDGYNPKAVIALLNANRERLLCVRGNCEAEVDQMVLSFPVMAEYAYLLVDGVTIFATHGHHAGESNPPPLCAGEILLCGHTHIPAIRVHESFVYLNPGSVSIPKGESVRSYMTLNEGVFELKALDDGERIKSFDARKNEGILSK